MSFSCSSLFSSIVFSGFGISRTMFGPDHHVLTYRSASFLKVWKSFQVIVISRDELTYNGSKIGNELSMSFCLYCSFPLNEFIASLFSPGGCMCDFWFEKSLRKLFMSIVFFTVYPLISPTYGESRLMCFYACVFSMLLASHVPLISLKPMFASRIYRSCLVCA
jgi:hypothetical protein